MTPTRDPQDTRIDTWLDARGAGAHLVGLGLAGLVARWEAVVAEVASGSVLGLDDYLNDLDLRQMLHELLATMPDTRAPLIRRLRDADRRLAAATRPVASNLWGDGTAARRGWTPRVNWWYHAVPRAMGDELTDDLRAAGITVPAG